MAPGPGGLEHTLQFREDCTWLPLQLAATALVWAWSDELTLGERFLAARRIAEHLYQPQQEFATSSQAFLKLLRRWTGRLVGLLQTCFRQRMQTALAAHWRLHGWIVFGVDGSRVELPRTKSHEAAYAPSAKRAGKKKRRSRRQKPRDAAHTKKARTPQLWLTMLWHAGTGLPWAWRIGATDSSEREHWLEMLPELPENVLVAADAGYVGYEYLRAVIASRRHLLLRVGSHVRLLRKLGWAKESAGTVYLWPDAAAQKNQSPLVLRLVVSHNGKHPVYLLTSVLSTSCLSDRQIIDLYRQRWGLWGMALYAQVVLTAHQINPARLSTACVLRVFRRLLRDYRHPLERGQTLRARLRHALRDAYPRKNKSSRDYPRKKRPDPQPGPPEILPASPTQITRARQIRANVQKGLAA